MKKIGLWVCLLVLLLFLHANQVFAGYEHIGLIENEQGTYNVLIWATEDGIPIQEVTVTISGQERKLLKSVMTSIYKLDELESMPTKVTIKYTDNTKLEEPFLEKPTVNYTNNYTVDLPIYRQDVQGTIVGTSNLFYTFNQTTKGCSASPCPFVIEKNGLLTVIEENGIKRSSVMIRIGNINKGELRLVLIGKREGTYGERIQFNWNYPLQNGQINCEEGGIAKTFAITANATSYVANGFNTKTICHLSGDYEGNPVTSNEIIIPIKANAPITGDSTVSNMLIDQDVYVEESRVGMSYFINIRRTNVDSNEAMIPVLLFP